MKFLDLTLPTPAENLACDEALLDWAEAHGGPGLLRFWEPESHFAVVGYANHVAREVNVAACQAANIPIFRRCSGGGTVLQGPGCLNYSLIAQIEENGPLATITSANRCIMERNRQAIESLLRSREGAGPEGRTFSDKTMVEVKGHTDLALVANDGSLKFSGNAQRRKKDFLLFHGTFLLQFDITLIGSFLQMPSKEPGYRQGRAHGDFLTNLDLPAGAVKTALCRIWGAKETMDAAPREAIALLARNKYVTKEWNFKL